jgi:RNA polymerase sigma-70 factor (ECF subfamily)
MWRVRPGRPPSPESARPSFDQVVLPNLDAAYSLARWLVRDAHLAEDVVQDAIVRGLTYYDSFRGGDARSWLMRIVRNTAYSALAARQSQRIRESEEGLAGEHALGVSDPGPSPEAALSGSQDGERLSKALAALPTELRECLVLKELEEMSYKEIAEVTGVPIGTVMSRLWRARQMLMGKALGNGHET